MKKLSKILVALIVTFLFTNVLFVSNATSIDLLSITNKSYDKTTGELVVEGTTVYDEVMVSLFDGEKLLSLKTVSRKSSKYSATFNVEFTESKTITIKVGDIESKDHEISSIDVTPTEKPKTLSDDQGNSITILGEGGFNKSTTLEVGIMADFSNLNDQEKFLMNFIQTKGFKSNQKIVAVVNIELGHGEQLPETNNGYKIRLYIPAEAAQGYHKLYIARLIDDQKPEIETAREFNYDSTINGVEFTANGLGTYFIYDETPEETNTTTPDTKPVELIATELTNAVVSVSKGNQNSAVVALDKYYKNQTYTLYKSTTTSKKKKWTKLGTFSGETLTATGLTFGQKTFFKVTVEFSGKKVDSNTVNITVKPDKATGLKVTKAGTTSIKLTWDKAGYTGYELQRSTKATSGFKKVTFLTKNTKTSYENKKLKNATTYYYRVRTYKTVKGKKVYGGFSDVVSATTGPAKPKTPSIKAVNYNTIALTLKKTKTAAYYEVSRSTKKTKGYTTIGATSELVFSDTVNTGTTYYYKVRACNAAGVCSGWTSQVNKKASLSKPTLSAGVTAVNIATDEQKREFVSELKDIIYSAETQFVNDSFNRENIVDGHVMNIGYFSLNGKSLVKNVKIDRINNSEPFYKELKQTTSIEFYIEFNLAGKIIAFFATNNALKFEYTGSGLDKSQIQDYVKPLSNDSKLTLTVGASDGATGYVIQRSTKKSSGFKKIADTTDLSYNDNKAKSGKTYWYRVRAYRLVGTKRVYSGYTKPIKVTVK